jgi:hypothetical protein
MPCAAIVQVSYLLHKTYIDETNLLKSTLGEKPLMAKIATTAVMIHCRHVAVRIGLAHKRLKAQFAGESLYLIHVVVYVST